MQTSRRSTLALGLGGAVGLGLLGLGATGCDAGDADPAGSGGAGGTDGSAGPGSEPDPDVSLVTAVLADLDTRLAAVVAARTAYPLLAPGLQGLEAMHQAHRALLDPDRAATAAPAPPAPGRTARAALRRVRAGEQAHGTALVEASVAARSGALARVLASMSASVGQHLLVAPTRPGAAP